MRNPKMIHSGTQAALRRHALLSLQLMSAFLLPATLLAQEWVDHNYEPVVLKPAYAAGTGPIVGIDEAHNNTHTAGEGFAPFAKLLRKDGYRVEAFTNNFTAQSLRKLDVLVIINAGGWTNQSLSAPSALDKSEMDAVENWVKSGGALLLLAGHMPAPRGSEHLAERFDVFFHNGFTFPRDAKAIERITPPENWFRKGLLAAVSNEPIRNVAKEEIPGIESSDSACRPALGHPIFAGRSPEERIPSMKSAWGLQALRLPPGGKARPLLVLEGECLLLLTARAWHFSDQTPRIRADGMAAAATVNVGKGRVVLFGVNAVWLNAQLMGQKPWGMNQPDAKHNAQFALNTLHWLTKLLPAE